MGNYPRIEDRPPFCPTMSYKLRRWITASEVPLALLLVGCIFVIGACVLTLVFVVMR